MDKGNSMGNYFKLAALGTIALFAAMAANWGRDAAYIVQAIIILGVSGFMFIRVLRQMEQPSTRGHLKLVCASRHIELNTPRARTDLDTAPIGAGEQK